MVLELKIDFLSKLVCEKDKETLVSAVKQAVYNTIKERKNNGNSNSKFKHWI